MAQTEIVNVWVGVTYRTRIDGGLVVVAVVVVELTLECFPCLAAESSSKDCRALVVGVGVLLVVVWLSCECECECECDFVLDAKPIDAETALMTEAIARVRVRVRVGVSSWSIVRLD